MDYIFLRAYANAFPFSVISPLQALLKASSFLLSSSSVAILYSFAFLFYYSLWMVICRIALSFWCRDACY